MKPPPSSLPRQECEDRDGKAADDEADTVDGIRVGNGFQTAEYRVAHADDAGADADEGDGAEIADAEHTLEVKDLDQCDRTRIQDGRQHGNDIRNQEQQREQAHGEGIVALSKNSGDGGVPPRSSLGRNTNASTISANAEVASKPSYSCCPQTPVRSCRQAVLRKGWSSSVNRR